ncbi:MAG: DUF3307 domain-containing protein [Hyphomicrobiaceae bacterium]|nr:DUF3307 domain-containing protein [Hyphomicrobiaceae bacterium]
MIAPLTILLAVGVLVTKHLVADFLLQTSYQAANKGRYGHIAGLTHAFNHAVLTPAVFLVLPPSSLRLGLGIVAAEYVWHYHQDWAKEKVTHGLGLTPADTGFWWGIGIDQFLHYMTYLAIIYALIVR